jgi:hypothetical protein
VPFQSVDISRVFPQPLEAGVQILEAAKTPPEGGVFV